VPGLGDLSPARRPLRAWAETHQAVHYWQQAGETAARRSAHHEAIPALRKRLTPLTTLPDRSERTRHELSLQLTLGELLMAAKGMVSLEAGDAFTRAHALCQLWQHHSKHGEARELLAEVYGWFTEDFDMVDLQEAKALVEELS
jgi:hypothetical protein